jgi:L-alanine-DL-glutamate epimerase-like enolase superfamily enzyme
MISLTIKKEVWLLDEPFVISRVSMTQSYVLVVELDDGGYVGRGECEPHESDDSYMVKVENTIENLREKIENGLTRDELNQLLPAGPARNAIDCAMWDLEAKKADMRVWELAGVDLKSPLVTAYTICIGSPEEMAEKATRHKHLDLLKLKLDSEFCLERVQAVRNAAPNPRIIVDANEAWTFKQLTQFAEPLAKLNVSLIEQPLPAGKDEELVNYLGSVPLCADESCHDRNSLIEVKERYQFINIKLDKTGGLTEALCLAEEAKTNGLRIMVGCMTGTSLAMAPAMLIGALAEFCDLDGPLLLARDRKPGLDYENSIIHIPQREVWG